MTDNALAWSKSIITISPARWISLVQSVPMELLSMRPAPNQWSAIECLQHVTDVERVSFPMRIKALLAQQPFAGFNPGDQPPKPAPTITTRGASLVGCCDRYVVEGMMAVSLMVSLAFLFHIRL